jgi:hypothetical protein
MADEQQQVPAALNGRGQEQAAAGGGMSSMKLPPFWHRSPASWFRTVEALFILKGVTDNVERYHQVVAALTEELADMVGSVVDEEPDQNSYEKIKAALVAINTLTPYQMVDTQAHGHGAAGGAQSERAADRHAEASAPH